jgi:cobalt-precorrin-7 (C5)-methyltransferase
MKIIGVGAAPGLITEQAKKEIQKAKIVYGSKRAIDIVKQYIDGDYIIITRFDKLVIPDDAVVLSTGDPMVSGLGFLEGEIIPGISSVQLVCSRLKIDLCDAVVIDGHAKDSSTIIQEVSKVLNIGRVAIILVDKNFDIEYMTKSLDSHGNRDCWVCENLGYSDEKIKKGSLFKPPKIESSLCVVVIL